ncbi:hypothetical protein GCM10007857_68160 [Bradyrhizobium iriomotense]|uniref:Uncharacterized protein n=1 Tax=Bradyrhizobium iriomotense TaxID=441950 RepID=A0ABQ6B6R3_9BRAD|nr:hypothetical protein GCM10007857_68160 [Bradyrhizobium iriomotense]
MKVLLLLVLLFVWAPVAAESSPPAAPKEDPSVRDQIKAARAREKADEATGPQERAWDRDAGGKRPWNQTREPPK